MKRRVLTQILLMGLAAFLVVGFNWLFFSGFIYQRALLMDSGSGLVHHMLHAEKTRQHPAGFKTAIVFGDSRLGEGFSAKVASETAEGDHLEIVQFVGGG